MKTKILILGILILILFSFGCIVTESVTLSNEYPLNNSINIDILQPTVNVTIYDPDIELFTWYIHGEYIINAYNVQSTETITPLPYSTLIVWYVNITDGESWTNATYKFTTETLNENSIGDKTGIMWFTGLISIVLLLGLFVYAINTIKQKSFNFETFINLCVVIIVVIVALAII